MAGLEMRGEEQDELRVRVVRGGAIALVPERVSEAGARAADVRVRVVAVDPPCLQNAIHRAVVAGTADVVHDFFAAALRDRLPDPPADVVEGRVP